MLSNQNQGAKVVNIIQFFSKVQKNKEYERKYSYFIFKFSHLCKISHVLNATSYSK